ncbi:ABC transporter substrate-binding protein [Promicromonospora sp. Populi]|uniref:ABC transporter substrate-binding protein n=1 Tax=Promicromonospora sp. Populi TaxID=3239420 RepID=UPI0034E1B77D
MNHAPHRLAAVALAATTALALAACGAAGADTTSTDDEAAPAGPFEYTDARGETVQLDTVPQTVVAQSSMAAGLWDAGYQVDGVYGELAETDGELSYQAGNIDLDQVTTLGATYGEFDVEDYGLMNPDLLIDYTYDGENLWYVPAEQAEQILGLAPSIGVGGTWANTDDAIAEFVDLAGKLGADTGSAELAADREAYEAALEDVSAASAETGLQVVVVSADADTLYVADPDSLPELSTLRAAGLDILDDEGADGEVFHQHSWEEAGDYADADVILFDARSRESNEADLAEIDTWASLPAVQAGQIYDWYAAAPYSYRAYAEIYQGIADALRAAEAL